MNTIAGLGHSVRRIVNVIVPVTDPTVAQQCAVDEVIIPFENMFKKSAIVNLFGAALFNVKHVRNLWKFMYANRISFTF